MNRRAEYVESSEWHDRIRRLAKHNETKVFKLLLKRDKLFQPPSSNGGTFKDLFKQAAAAGVGRPVDKDGFPEGPWTPDLLADAISQIDANRTGIDLRTVQLWFQDNEKGISADNIRWLARVFGCGDPAATSEWQAELSAAQSRLAAKRRQKRKSAPRDQLPVPDAALSNLALVPEERPQDAAAVQPKRRFSLARTSEALFHGRNSLNLPIAVWASGGVLWFLAYIMGVHSVTYSPIEGLDKQVGFYWSLSWTVGEMALLPLFLIFAAELLSFWKEDGRASLAAIHGDLTGDEGWTRKVDSFSLSYWAIFLICFLMVFFVQWAGVYLRTLLQGDPGNAMLDWILVVLARPEVASVPEAIMVSMFAFLYSGMIYWFFFIGLLLLYTIASDYCGVRSAPELDTNEEHQRQVYEAGTTIMRGIFRCTVLGILLATCIKLNAAYLISDGATIADWLINDMRAAFGVQNAEWDWLDQSPSPFFTSFLLLFVTCFVFFVCFAQIYWVLDLSAVAEPPVGTKESRQEAPAKILWFKMVFVVVLLAATFLLVGQFHGFSILLAGSVVVAIGSLFWRTQEQEFRKIADAA